MGTLGMDDEDDEDNDDDVLHFFSYIHKSRSIAHAAIMLMMMMTMIMITFFKNRPRLWPQGVQSSDSQSNPSKNLEKKHVAGSGSLD